MSFKPDFNFSNDKQVLEKCLVPNVVHSPTPSYTRNIIAARVVFATAGKILNSLVLYSFHQLMFLLHKTILGTKVSYHFGLQKL